MTIYVCVVPKDWVYLEQDKSCNLGNNNKSIELGHQKTFGKTAIGTEI